MDSSRGHIKTVSIKKAASGKDNSNPDTSECTSPLPKTLDLMCSLLVTSALQSVEAPCAQQGQGGAVRKPPQYHWQLGCHQVPRRQPVFSSFFPTELGLVKSTSLPSLRVRGVGWQDGTGQLECS